MKWGGSLISSGQTLVSGAVRLILVANAAPAVLPPGHQPLLLLVALGQVGALENRTTAARSPSIGIYDESHQACIAFG